MRFFKSRLCQAPHSRIPEFRQLVHMIMRHLTFILNYCENKARSAVAEGWNSKKQAIKHISFGKRNEAHYETEIFATGEDLSFIYRRFRRPPKNRLYPSYIYLSEPQDFSLPLFVSVTGIAHALP